MPPGVARALAGIFLLALASFWVAWPGNQGLHIEFLGFSLERDIRVHQGLDIQGGMQVTLEADVPPGTAVARDTLEAARAIVENRINALGVSEPEIRIAPDKNRIYAELPGVKDPEQAVRTFQGTGLLEFIDAGSTPLRQGELIATDYAGPGSITPETALAPTATPTPMPSPTPEPTAGAVAPTPVAEPTPAATPTPRLRVYHTVMTGEHLKSAQVAFNQLGQPEIQFSLKPDGAKIFADYTMKNVNQYLAITMDKVVLSSPVIQEPITGGEGRITGRFSLAEAQSLVIQLKYGALPVPLKVVERRSVGPTLGQDSVRKSLLAGTFGLAIVAFFMLAYYRLAGALADLALLVYAAIVFALFKLIPVVLTLAGIAGFILSIGMAVDANILIFERMREEIRAGKTLGAAIEAGFDRAWTSIRDSNVSTLITCAILYWFGSNFSVSIIRGFALTLAIGVLVSMFTAITVTRSFLRAVHFATLHNPGLARAVQRWL